MDIKHVGLEGLDRINLGEDSDKLHAVVNMLYRPLGFISCLARNYYLLNKDSVT